MHLERFRGRGGVGGLILDAFNTFYLCLHECTLVCIAIGTKFGENAFQVYPAYKTKLVQG